MKSYLNLHNPRLISVIYAFIAFLWLCSAACGQTNTTWRTLKGEHFIVQYTGSEAVAQELLNKAEKHRKAIADRFGFVKQGDFWLWDDRVRIKLFEDVRSFRAAENAPDWAEGKAEVGRRELAFTADQPDWQETVLPHEISHLLFREFIGIDKEVPLWLVEGVSQLVEKDRGKQAKERVRELKRAGKAWTLETLSAVDHKTLVTIQSPHDFYAHAVSFTSFLVDRYGAERFRALCVQLKSGSSLESALRFTYPENVRTIDALEKAWIKDLEDKP